MINFGVVTPGSTIYIPFESFAGSTGAPITITGLATSDIRIYKNGGTTERASTNGYTLLDTDGIDFDSVTGIHGFSIDLADNTTSGFYAAGADYIVVVSAVTVDSQTMSFIAARFSIGYPHTLINTTIATLANQTTFTLTTGPGEDDALNGLDVIIHDAASAVQIGQAVISDYVGATKSVTLAAATTFTIAAGDNISVLITGSMRPEFAGRKLSVSAAGIAQADVVRWNTLPVTEYTDGSSINHPSVYVYRMAGDTIVAGAIAAGAITSAKFASGAITADAIAADAITDAKVASDVTIASVTGAVGSVTGNVGGNVTGSVGAIATGGITAASFAAGAIDAAAIAADAITDAKVASDVTIASVTGSVGSIATGGISAASFAAGAIDAAAIAADAIGSSELAATAVAEIADQVWDEVLSGHAGVGSAGAALSAAGGSGDPWSTALPGAYGAGSAGYIIGTYIDAAITSRLAPTTSGRTLDVTAGGEAGIDWSNIGSPTTSVTLSGTTIKTATDVETDTVDIQSRLPAALVSGRIDASVGAMAANTLTASALATDAVTEIQSGLSTVTTAQVNSEVDTALADIGLDHIVAAAVAGADVVDNSIIAKLVSKSATADWDSYTNTTDALEALRDRGDSAWITATGFSTLDAAGVRSAVGLSSANLDTQLAALAAYVDTEVAAIKAKTDNLPAAPAATGDIPTVSQIWSTALTEAYRSTGATGTAAQLLYELIAHLGEASISGTTKTLKKLDGSTTAKTYTLNDATTPTAITEAT